MSKDLYSKKQKIEICCGLDIIIPALIMGATSITQFWHNWYLGLIFTVIGVIIIFAINNKKYALTGLVNVLTFKRAVIVDSLVTAFALVFLWAYLYIPVPFSADKFLNPQPYAEIPFGAWIFCTLLLYPSLKTNKRISQYL